MRSHSSASATSGGPRAWGVFRPRTASAPQPPPTPYGIRPRTAFALGHPTTPYVFRPRAVSAPLAPYVCPKPPVVGNAR